MDNGLVEMDKDINIDLEVVRNMDVGSDMNTGT
jgi:hypothetical protein